MSQPISNLPLDINYDNTHSHQHNQQHPKSLLPLTVRINQPKFAQYQGSSTLWCGGRFVRGPQPIRVLISFLLIMLPIALFLPFVAVDINQVSGPWAFVVVSVLTLISVVTLLLASLTNPGILPRSNLQWGLQIHDHDIPTSATSTANTNAAHFPTHVKYCYTCKIFRPLRTVHCSVCDNCVFHLDHHCPWLGTCVGGGNYHYFLYFLYSLMIEILISIAINAYSLYAVPNHRFKTATINNGRWTTLTDAFTDYIAVRPYALILIAYSLMALAMVGYLWGFHIGLNLKSQTTIEHIKRTYSKENGKNPFARSILRNILALLFPTHTRSPRQNITNVASVLVAEITLEEEKDQELILKELQQEEQEQKRLKKQQQQQQQLNTNEISKSNNGNSCGLENSMQCDGSFEHDTIESKQDLKGNDSDNNNNDDEQQDELEQSLHKQSDPILQQTNNSPTEDHHHQHHKIHSIEEVNYIIPEVEYLYPNHSQQTIHESLNAYSHISNWSHHHITKTLQAKYQYQFPPPAPGPGTQHHEIDSAHVNEWIEKIPQLKDKCMATTCKLTTYENSDADLIMNGVRFVTDWE